MHAMKPSLNGKDLSKFKDPNNVFLFNEMVAVSKKDGQGFVDYAWEKNKGETPSPKTSFVRLFKPWGWIIGTGVYMDQVESVINGIIKKLVLWFTLAAVFALCLAILSAWKQNNNILLPVKKSIYKLKKNSDQLNSVGGVLNAESSSLTDSVNTQTENVVQLVSATTQMNAMIGRSKTDASTGQETISQTVKITNDCAEAVKNVSIHVESLVQNNESILNKLVEDKNSLNELVAQMEEISAKTKFIEDIVFQTKLLSFNASVEAARAGEHGKGFSVVAEEIGNLASNSGENAQVISDIVSESLAKVYSLSEGLEKNSVESLRSTNEIRSRVESSLSDCKRFLEQVINKMSSSSKTIDSIVTALDEQFEGSQNVTKSSGNLEKINDTNKSGNEKLRVVSQNLNDRTEDLTHVVEALSKIVS